MNQVKSWGMKMACKRPSLTEDEGKRRTERTGTCISTNHTEDDVRRGANVHNSFELICPGDIEIDVIFLIHHLSK